LVEFPAEEEPALLLPEALLLPALLLPWLVLLPVVVVAPVPVLDPPVVEEPVVVVPPVFVELSVVVPVVVLDGTQETVPPQLQPQVLQSVGQLEFTPLFTPGASPGQEQDPPWTQNTQPVQLSGAVPQLPEVRSQHCVPLNKRFTLSQQSTSPLFLL
jgi:hypothetical protein